MSDYTIAAIPTLYRGRQYRSRLEAKWAAFFDLLGWRHEYEPFDLGTWSPDFLLPEWRCLVEVKPLEDFNESVWDKALNACKSRGMLEESNEHEALGAIFVTRLVPTQSETGGVVQIGWFGSHSNQYAPVEAHLLWIPDYGRPVFAAEMLSLFAQGWFSASGDADIWSKEPWQVSDRPVAFGNHTMGLWAQASNAVQYQRGARS